MKKRDAGQEKREESRSTKKMVETANRQEFEDTEEIVQLRSICQKGIEGLGKELCGTLEEDVLGEVQG